MHDLEIDRVHGHGDENREYVVLRALRDCHLGGYGLTDTTFTAQGLPSNLHTHTFWFPRWRVKRGDTFYVFTRQGKNTYQVDEVGRRHFYLFWGLGTPVWNDSGDIAVLFRATHAIRAVSK